MSINPYFIKSEEETLSSILSDKRPLHVPAYQRCFSWTKTEITDLWDDLQSVIGGEHDSYFLGSMVFILRADNSLEVVDGQQRLATISLFLAAIRDGFNKANDIERAQLMEADYLCSRNIRSMEAYPKLQLNEIDKTLFYQIIDGSKTHNEITLIAKNKEIFESNRLIAQAYLLLFEFARLRSSNFTDTDYLSVLVEAITDKISCIQIITSSEDSAYLLFETLNDRGIDLTLSDMLKNFLFSKAGRRLDEVKHKWTEIVTLIGQEHMKTFIRHEWMSRYGQTREKDLYKKIKSEIRSNPKAIEYISMLREAATIYDAIRNPDSDIWTPYGAKCRKLLEDLLTLGSIQSYPLVLSAYLAKRNDLITILKWTVSLIVRYSIIGAKGTGNLETTYAKASSMLRRDSTSLRHVRDVLAKIWPNDDEFKTSFKEKTLTTPRIIKYLLSELEAYMTGDISLIPNPEILSVEHILPKRPSQEWSGKMREDEFLREYVNRIGNLTILTEPMNRDCESRSFSFKKNLYKHSRYKTTQDVCSYENWTAETIAERQEQLAEVAAKVWTL